MKMFKIVGAVVLAASAAVSMSVAANAFPQSEYYINFYIGNQQVGHAFVPCGDSPAEYVLVWGTDSGEREIVGRDACALFPFPF